MEGDWYQVLQMRAKTSKCMQDNGATLAVTFKMCARFQQRRRKKNRRYWGFDNGQNQSGAEKISRERMVPALMPAFICIPCFFFLPERVHHVFALHTEATIASCITRSHQTTPRAPDVAEFFGRCCTFLGLCWVLFYIYISLFPQGHRESEGPLCETGGERLGIDSG